MSWRQVIRARRGAPVTWELTEQPEWTIERVGHGFQIWRVVDPTTRLAKKLGSYATLPAAQHAVDDLRNRSTP